jgi:hypothetical protein
MKYALKTVTLFIMLVCFTTCENEPIGDIITTENAISTESELYNQLVRVASDSVNAQAPIACIDFIYPVTLYVFNENLELLNSIFILTDQQFSNTLGNLESDYSISVSYPITTTLNDGSTFTISTNAELKEAIDNCIEEEQEEEIAYCQNLIQNCVWKIGYIHNTENTYLGGIFQEDNGATTFIFENNLYFGSWNVLFIEDELHINISLNNGDTVGEAINFDWKVQYLNNNSVLLTNEDRQMVLHQYCDNDYALCNTFEFEVCEMEANPGYAEITTEDFNYCINHILHFNDDEHTITYHQTYDDALDLINEISQDQPYVNIIPNSQFLYARIINIENQNSYIVQITINIISC